MYEFDIQPPSNYPGATFGYGNRISLSAKIIIAIIIIAAIVIVIYTFIKYIVIPAMKGEILSSLTAYCTKAPTKPTNLSVSVIDSRADITWNKSTNAVYYTVYIGNRPNFPPGIAQRTIKVPASTNVNDNTESIAVLKLSPISHYCKITATNDCGTSSFSDEIVITISYFPDLFKLCKRNNPLLCLNIPEEVTASYMSATCENENCFLSYDFSGDNRIGRNDGFYCLYRTNIAPIESGVEARLCAETQPWTFDLSTGRIIGIGNKCLGSDNADGRQAYSTDCNLITNPDDDRYLWDVQPQ